MFRLVTNYMDGSQLLSAIHCLCQSAFSTTETNMIKACLSHNYSTNICPTYPTAGISQLSTRGRGQQLVHLQDNAIIKNNITTRSIRPSVIIDISLTRLNSLTRLPKNKGNSRTGLIGTINRPRNDDPMVWNFVVLLIYSL